MSFIVGILTVLLVLNCLLLILLVLIQLPKKDAGVGMAFGGGAADALFGAGSGNALTKITKYATIIFFAMALVLGHLESRLHQSSSASEFEKQLQQRQMQTPITQPPPPSQPAAAPTNNLLSMPLTSPTGTPVPAPTNMPAGPTQSK
ncbi:MAG: preprotein translocase subunit SecG [Verrucomicrobiota bacterium]|jgi:preprotein translocase subunit SecG